MARHLFDFAVSGGAPAATVTIYSDSACTTAADIQTAAGAGISGGVITPALNKRLTFLGPNNVRRVYAKPYTDTTVVVILDSQDAGDGANDAEIDVSSSTAAATYVAKAATSAPASPSTGQEYLSSAYRDLRVPPSVSDRKVVLTNPSWSTSSVQEPSLWQANSRINMLFTGNTGIGYAWCSETADPLVAANWTHVGSGPVIGAGSAGVAGLVNHGSVYVEGSTLYYYANVPADNTIKVWTAPITTPTVWTLVGTVIALQAGMTVWGNTNVVKDGSTYRMLIEYKETSTGRWQLGTASCATVTGTYVMAITKLQSVWPDTTDWASAGGPDLHFENGEWVLYYHASLNWNGGLPVNIYRATTTDLTTDAWTLTDNLQPIVRRVAAYEVDQVADVCVLRLTSGEAYAVWVGVDNRSPFAARMYGALLLPTRRRYNGTTWQSQEVVQDTSTSTRLPQKVRTKHQATDWTSTTTNAWETVASGDLSLTHAPNGTDFEVELRLICSPTGSVGFIYKFQVLVNSVAYTLGAVSGTSGNRCVFIGVARIPQQIPGKYLPVTVQAWVPTGGGTVNIRPVGQAGQEYAVLKATDVTYP